jgi:hypothetical protein
MEGGSSGANGGKNENSMHSTNIGAEFPPLGLWPLTPQPLQEGI